MSTEKVEINRSGYEKRSLQLEARISSLTEGVKQLESRIEIVLKPEAPGIEEKPLGKMCEPLSEIENYFDRMISGISYIQGKIDFMFQRCVL